jgi:hypothetical protein
MANYRRSPVVRFSRLSDRLPEISFRRTGASGATSGETGRLSASAFRFGREFV